MRITLTLNLLVATPLLPARGLAQTWTDFNGLLRSSCESPDKTGKSAIYLGFGPAEYDALHADLLAKGVMLKDGRWGKRLMIVEDPDGNQLWFADPHDPG